MIGFFLEQTEIEGLFVISAAHHSDARGSFSKIFSSEVFAQLGWRGGVKQINLSSSSKPGTLRGLHFQVEGCHEFKLVGVVKGKAWDVVADVRPESITFGKSFSTELAEDRNTWLVIPPGCAHGFQTLESDTELLYAHNVTYRKESDEGINPFDKNLQIAWPLAVAEISQRDKSLPYLADRFLNHAL